MGRKNDDDVHPLAVVLACILVGLYFFWIYVIKPAIQWIQMNYILIITGFLSIAILCGVVFYLIGRNETSYENEQNDRGLYKYEAINGETRWGSQENISKWKRNDDECLKENSFINGLIREIEGFQPTRKYPDEYSYQIELQGWLKRNYSQSKIEVQSGSSRPDIIIDHVAIEIKGPTRTKDLQTLADKLLRYRNYYKYIIIVLFDVQIKDRYYNEWMNGVNDRYNKDKDEVKIIRKK